MALRIGCLQGIERAFGGQRVVGSNVELIRGIFLRYSFQTRTTNIPYSSHQNRFFSKSVLTSREIFDIGMVPQNIGTKEHFIYKIYDLCKERILPNILLTLESFRAHEIGLSKLNKPNPEYEYIIGATKLDDVIKNLEKKDLEKLTKRMSLILNVKFETEQDRKKIKDEFFGTFIEILGKEKLADIMHFVLMYICHEREDTIHNVPYLKDQIDYFSNYIFVDLCKNSIYTTSERRN